MAKAAQRVRQGAGTRAASARLLLAVLLAAGAPISAQDSFDFDTDSYRPRPWELRGFFELEPTFGETNGEAARYRLNAFDDEPRSSFLRLPGALEFEGRYRKGDTTFSLRTHSTKVWGDYGEGAEHDLFEGVLTYQSDPGLSLDVGKKAYRWGTGYAWNPVAFVEQAKDAGNPDLAREGFWTLGLDWIRSFDGPLKTVAFTPLVLPNEGGVNEDFGREGHTNLAGRLYLLYGNTDIHLMALGKGSKSARYGMDFASNLTPNFAIHGELARITDVSALDVTPECGVSRGAPEDVLSYLAGLRFRTDDDITFIAEYYYNGAGNSEEAQRRFYECVHRAWETADRDLLADLPLKGDLDRGPFTKPNAGRRYVNLRAWWNEPGDVLYLVPGFQVLHNLDDGSYSVAPEVNYEVVENLALRLRVTVPFGDRLTEWGEKPNDYKVELRMRYYF